MICTYQDYGYVLANGREGVFRHVTASVVLLGWSDTDYSYGVRRTATAAVSCRPGYGCAVLWSTRVAKTAAVRIKP